MGVGVAAGRGWASGSLFRVRRGRPARYTAHMDILVHDGEKPQDNADAYDGFSVVSRLQPKIFAGGS